MPPHMLCILHDDGSLYAFIRLRDYRLRYASREASLSHAATIDMPSRLTSPPRLIRAALYVILLRLFRFITA